MRLGERLDASRLAFAPGRQAVEATGEPAVADQGPRADDVLDAVFLRQRLDLVQRGR